MNEVAKKRVINFNNKNMELYLLMVPGLIFLLIFKYIPISGILIAFQDFNIFAGSSQEGFSFYKALLNSEWVGLENFRKLISSPEFYRIFMNTLIISFMKITILFPLPIFIAIVINEIRSIRFQRCIQTVIYLPHFISWVIVGGLFINILSPSNGLVNDIIKMFGGEPIAFMTNKAWFRWVLVASEGWKEFGWNTIIYLSAISGIDQQLYEAAKIDGAGRIKQILYITIPSITTTIVLLFILKIGHVLDAGFQQVLIMYNPVVYEVADIIETYVYRVGLGGMDYSFSTAVGMFKSVVGFILVFTGNALSRKLTHKSIW